MNPPSFFLRASSALAALAFVFASGSSRAEVPPTMKKDFVTARNHVLMKWNPQGYWVSPPGAFRGKGSTSEVCAAYTATEMSRGRIPRGYSFSVSGTGQFIASSGQIGKPVTSPPPAPVAAAPALEVASPPVKPAASVADTPQPAPIPSTAVRAAIMDPVHVTRPTTPPGPAPTVKPSPLPVPPAPSAPPVPPLSALNGIPGDLQKSFLSRHKSVFMLFDKDEGKWKSSEGAIRDTSAADEWCKQATAIDREWKRIPETFSYKHVGGGQVEATRD